MASKSSKNKKSSTTTASKTSARRTPVKTAATATVVAKVEAVVETPRQTNLAALPGLIAGLRHIDADTAREAAEALGRVGDVVAVEALSAVVINAEGFYHPVVRAAAAGSLGLLKDRRAVPALIVGVRDWMAEASAESVRALAAIGDASAVAPLIDVLANREGFYLPTVRRAAVIALKSLNVPAGIEAIRAVAMCETEDAVVRQTAFDALSK